MFESRTGENGYGGFSGAAYINTEYVVQLSQKNGKINAEPNQMLSGYIDQLEEMIMEKYSRKTDRLKLNFDGLKEADYLDAGKILDSAAAGIQILWQSAKKKTAVFTRRPQEKASALWRKSQQFPLNFPGEFQCLCPGKRAV